MKFLALLRGINVGGNNIISKEVLKTMFEKLDFVNVRTYIQSGNVLFCSNNKNIDEIINLIEKSLFEYFSKNIFVVVFSFDTYRMIMQLAPKDWGRDDSKKHNLLFLLPNISVKNILNELPKMNIKLEINKNIHIAKNIKDKKIETENIKANKYAIFYSISKEYLSKSYYQQLPKLKVYKKVTIRNHNTVFKLLDLFDEIS